MKWYSSWQKKERFLITLWSALRSFSCVSHMDQYMWFLLKRFPRAAIEWIRTCFMLCTRYCSCSTHVAMRVPSIDVLLPLFCYAVATLLIYCCHSIDTLLPLYWYAVVNRISVVATHLFVVATHLSTFECVRACRFEVHGKFGVGSSKFGAHHILSEIKERQWLPLKVSCLTFEVAIFGFLACHMNTAILQVSVLDECVLSCCASVRLPVRGVPELNSTRNKLHINPHRFLVVIAAWNRSHLHMCFVFLMGVNSIAKIDHARWLIPSYFVVRSDEATINKVISLELQGFERRYRFISIASVITILGVLDDLYFVRMLVEKVCWNRDRNLFRVFRRKSYSTKRHRNNKINKLASKPKHSKSEGK